MFHKQLSAAILVVLCYPHISLGQSPKVSESMLGVDVLHLTDGTRLLGFALGQQPDGGLRFSIDREWLAGTLPKLAEELVSEEQADVELQRQELITRLDQWLEERPEPGHLRRMLELERKRLEQPTQDANVDKAFFLKDFPQDQIRKLTIQTPDRRQIAGIAYQNRVQDIPTTAAADLQRQLEEIGVDAAKEQVDLTSELPDFQHQTDMQWAAKKAIIEFDMRESLEYQGTGDMLIRKGEQADAAGLIGQLLGAGGGDAISQLGAELGLPEFQPKPQVADWWRKVTTAAEKGGFRGVLITRLQQNMLSSNVTVEANFFAMQAPGKWFLVQKFVSKSATDRQAQERIERLQDDPQIQSVLKTIEALGLSASDQMDQALRHGAATQEALETVQQEWRLFAERYNRSLASMPIPLPGNP